MQILNLASGLLPKALCTYSWGGAKGVGKSLLLVATPKRLELRIRIRIQSGKNDPQEIENREEISSFEVLNVFQLYIFFKFLVITLDPDPHPDPH